MRRAKPFTRTVGLRSAAPILAKSRLPGQAAQRNPVWQVRQLSSKSRSPFLRRRCAMALTLVVGNKNYSSWSMRPWVAMRAAGLDFDEVVLPLYTGIAADKQRILDYSPAGKVP